MIHCANTVYHFLLFSVCFCFTVNASVNPVFFVRQLENMHKFLLDGSDAAGIFAVQYIRKTFRQIDFFLFRQLSISDYIYGYIWINIADNINIDVNHSIYFDDVLFAHFPAFYIFDDGD